MKLNLKTINPGGFAVSARCRRCGDLSSDLSVPERDTLLTHLSYVAVAKVAAAFGVTVFWAWAFSALLGSVFNVSGLGA